VTAADRVDIRTLQLEVEAWRQRNYGKCQPWEQLLGLCEELGEATEAMGDNAAFGDGIGDSAIYLLNFCTSMGWDAAELYDLRNLYEQPSRPWPILVGRLAHHYVKGFVQNYRGTREEHEARAKASASALFATWEKLCAGMGTTFIGTLEATWAIVGKRDWTKERPVPVAIGDARRPTSDVVRGLAAVIDSLGPTDTDRPPPGTVVASHDEDEILGGRK
jgi:NTP pyrophosphatase (non-canonical NTP hydrolase)